MVLAFDYHNFPFRFPEIGVICLRRDGRDYCIDEDRHHYPPFAMKEEHFIVDSEYIRLYEKYIIEVKYDIC